MLKPTKILVKIYINKAVKPTENPKKNLPLLYLSDSERAGS